MDSIYVCYSSSLPLMGIYNRCNQINLGLKNKQVHSCSFLGWEERGVNTSHAHIHIATFSEMYLPKDDHFHVSKLEPHTDSRESLSDNHEPSRVPTRTVSKIKFILFANTEISEP